MTAHFGVELVIPKQKFWVVLKKISAWFGAGLVFSRKTSRVVLEIKIPAHFGVRLVDSKQKFKVALGK